MDKNRWFTETIRTFETRLFRFTAKKVQRDLAADMVQETFLKLWNHYSPDLIGREGPWLFTVSRNLCLDLLRKEQNNRSEPLQDANMSSDETPLLQNMIQKENQSRVIALVSSLNENQQEVIRLKFQEGFSYKEISEITGHSVSHVGVLIHEAVAKLRHGIGGEL